MIVQRIAIRVDPSTEFLAGDCLIKNNEVNNDSYKSSNEGRPVDPSMEILASNCLIQNNEVGKDSSKSSCEG